MRRVHKRPSPPPCLAERKGEVARIERESGTLGDRWDEIKDCKASLRDAIWHDQHGLCAYCGGAMPNDESMKIEHFVPRSVDRDRILDWANLLGCCSGQYTEAGRTVTHCDSHRTPGERLHVHPVASVRDPGDLFKVNVSARRGTLGEISAQSEEARHDLLELNLNAPRLVENRRRVVEQLRRKLRSLPDDGARRRFIRARLEAIATTTHQLPPYAHVTVAYLEGKSRAHDL